MKERIGLGIGLAPVILIISSILLPMLTKSVEAGWLRSGNPLPVINTLSPSGVQAGSPSFTLTVNGTSFIGNSIVRWDGADRATTFVSATRLTIQVQTSDISATGSVSVTVFNSAPNGGESNVALLQVNNKTNTTTTIVSHNPNPSTQGEAVAVGYTVTATTGTPTGTVTVSDGVSTCSATVASGGCSIMLATAGTRTLTATYSGDSSFNDSAASVSQVIVGPQYVPFIGKAPTPTPTPPPPPTPIPNPVQNGGFEQSNSQNGPWYAIVTYTGQSAQGIDVRIDAGTLNPVGVSPHSGNYAAWLGGLPGNGYQMNLQQQITVPAGGSTLRYWVWIQSGESTCDLNNVDGAWVFFITDQQHQVDAYSLCAANNTNGWVKRDLDLSNYVGQMGWLTFTTRILGANSNWFIDDVQMGTLSGSSFRPYTH